MPKISQLPLLQYFVEDRVSLFRKKVWVDPPIFNDILDEISDHAVFQNQLNNKFLSLFNLQYSLIMWGIMEMPAHLTTLHSGQVSAWGQ